MRRLTVYRLDVPYREPLRVEAFEFGEHQGVPTCSIVGSMRGDEVQQAYACARVVERLEHVVRHHGQEMVIVGKGAEFFQRHVRRASP